MRDWSRRVQGVAAVAVGVALAAVTLGGPADTPSSAPTTSQADPGRPPPDSDVKPTLTTRATISSVAGRVDATKRARVKAVVVRIVDTYLDGAFVAGTYPRDDFTAAFADFRQGAAADALTDLDLLTNHDIGSQVESVTATQRRVRIDLLAPDGRPAAATARFVLEFETTGSVASKQTVAGSLFLTNQQGAWTVFGYDVRKAPTT